MTAQRLDPIPAPTVAAHDCPVTFQDPPERGVWRCTCDRLWTFRGDSAGWQCVAIVINGVAHHPSTVREGDSGC